ncbi:MAG: hypothetical protein M3116_01725, partial [Actinomycetota bacterium]|nr:hypothetical protein [Actinomycetota bacterium]
MERRPSRRRRLLSWVPSVVLLLLVAGFAVAAVGVNNSWWVDPDPTAAADQTAPNGSSVFTGAGIDFLKRTGEVLIRMDEAAVPAEELGLDPQGVRTVTSYERPLLVRVIGSDGALAVDRADELVLTTQDGALVSVDVRRPVPEGFLQAHAMLTDVADLYGWPAEQVAAVPDRYGEARREHPDK